MLLSLTVRDIDSFIMLISVLLLLLVCETRAGFHGYVFISTAKPNQVVIHSRFTFSSCAEFDSCFCGGSCSSRGDIHKIDESVGEWCQKEFTYNLAEDLFFYEGWWYGRFTWVTNKNGITAWKGLDYQDRRKRSDIGKANSTPQTAVLPAVRVPSNCQINVNLLNFDPDGDVVKCRYADGSLSECYTCTPPSVLSVSSSCALSFSPTNSSNEGSYAVQMLMEDFPRQTITLTDSTGAQVVKTTRDAISHAAIEFVLIVVPAVPSCSEGLYLPMFLPPTLENGARLNAVVNQTLLITVNAEAAQSVITGLLFSGPYNVVKNASGSGTFTLTWTPADIDNNESHPICFVVQATYSGSVYQSEHRCILVTVRAYYVFYLRMKITTTLSLMNNKDLLEKAITDHLISRGMPSFIRVRLLSNELVEVKTFAPPSG